ncbi:hypothetical protein D3C71_1701840 [compost metagenome]
MRMPPVTRQCRDAGNHQRGDGGRGEPHPFVAVERQRQRRHADRQHDKAADVEATGLHAVIGHQQQRGDGTGDPHRDIDQENPVPTGVLHQKTAQRRPH